MGRGNWSHLHDGALYPTFTSPSVISLVRPFPAPHTTHQVAELEEQVANLQAQLEAAEAGRPHHPHGSAGAVPQVPSAVMHPVPSESDVMQHDGIKKEAQQHQSPRVRREAVLLGGRVVCSTCLGGLRGEQRVQHDRCRLGGVSAARQQQQQHSEQGSTSPSPHPPHTACPLPVQAVVGAAPSSSSPPGSDEEQPLPAAFEEALTLTVREGHPVQLTGHELADMTPAELAKYYKVHCSPRKGCGGCWGVRNGWRGQAWSATLAAAAAPTSAAPSPRATTAVCHMSHVPANPSVVCSSPAGIRE